MKKIISMLAFATLLFGCGSDDRRTELAFDELEDFTEVSEATLTDDLFITLSAEILCLPTNNPDTTTEEIEILAKNILAAANVREETFSIYQQTIEADQASKDLLSFAIVGKMSEFCTIIKENFESPENETEEVLVVVEDSETAQEEEVVDEIPEEVQVENGEEVVVGGEEGALDQLLDLDFEVLDGPTVETSETPEVSDGPAVETLETLEVLDGPDVETPETPEVSGDPAVAEEAPETPAE